MFKLCTNTTNITKTTEQIMGMLDRDNSGEVSDEELSKINLNVFHNEAYGSDSIYRKNKYFKKIDVENLRVALNRDKDSENIIDKNDIELLAYRDIIDENIFSLVELIAISDAFGEYKDNLMQQCGILRTRFRRTEVALAEKLLNDQKGFGELFFNKTMRSPLPINPY